MKVKIFERSGEPGRLEREINDFLATLGPGAVLNTQTAIAAVRNENEQIETEYVGTHPASTPGGRDGLPRSAQAAAAALDCWFAFQFQGSRSATLLAW